MHEAQVQEPPAALIEPASATPSHEAETAHPASGSLPKVQTFVLPVDALAQVAQDSGLSWVNSDAEKIKVAQEAIAALPQAIHVPREPAQRVVVDEGPLVLVETRRDLRNLTLPFEQPASPPN